MAKQQRRGPPRKGRSGSTPIKTNCSKTKSTPKQTTQKKNAQKSTDTSTSKVMPSASQKNSIQSSDIPTTITANDDAILPATNDPTCDSTKDDSNETVKSAEKPPENTPYKSALMEEDVPMIAPTKLSTFLLQKKIHDDFHKPESMDNDEDTVTHENSTSVNEFSHSTRMTMMFRLPTKKTDVLRKMRHLLQLEKMNLSLIHI